MPILQKQIDDARMKVHTDSYPMSIGELVNLYEDKELDIHPEFQRVYRWSNEQKSKLIESILLGIPLPSIFVAQRPDGIWDVVDGLQRISTILSFLGKLRNEDGEVMKPLTLQSTKYLPALEGKVWENPHSPENEIHIEIKRVFKREKLDLKIIKRESEGDAKFELFQRLNTGGSRLSDQEVRNCMLIMLNSQHYQWLKELASDGCFIETTPISDRQEEECYRQELALRFIVHRHTDNDIKKEHSDVGPYLDAELTKLFGEKSNLDQNSEKETFINTFRIINEALNENSFKKFNHLKDRYEGAISLPVYEAMTVGISSVIEAGNYVEADLITKIQAVTKALTSDQRFIDTLDKRSRPLDRMIVMKELGLELYK